MKYVAQFERISRDHNVPPLEISVYEGRGLSAGSHPSPENIADQLAEAIYRYAHKRTVSKGIEVVVDLEKMSGTIYAGLHVAGSFTLEEARDQ